MKIACVNLLKVLSLVYVVELGFINSSGISIMK